MNRVQLLALARAVGTLAGLEAHADHADDRDAAKATLDEIATCGDKELRRAVESAREAAKVPG